MESTIEDEEQIYVKKEANQIENDKLDLDVMLLMLNNIANAYAKNVDSIERPIRQPISDIGYAYIENVLKEDPVHFRLVYRMYPSSFRKLCELIRLKACIRDTRHICVEEMVATFLLIVGQSSRYGYTKDTFKRSIFDISEIFTKF